VSTEILLPKLGFSMNEGTLSQWLIADGAPVKEGEPLYALESEKSVQECLPWGPCWGRFFERHAA
jgi:pyruvate/2-oxoglutarate dehydrogenase complex dihydrolipoamide acyltransferase (E2) component